MTEFQNARMPEFKNERMQECKNGRNSNYDKIGENGDKLQKYKFSTNNSC